MSRPRPRRRRRDALPIVLLVALVLAVSGDALGPSASAPGVTGRPPRVEQHVQGPKEGLLVSATALAALPTSGAAWEALLDRADESSRPDIADQDSNNDVDTLARALVFARTGDSDDREGVLRSLRRVIGSERGGRTLALARNLPGYVLAADLVDLPTIDREFDRERFRPWLRRVVERRMSDGRSLVEMHEEQGNNWGAHAGAALAAVYAYLGDRAGLEHTARVVRGFLGDTAAWYGWRYRQRLDWACGPRPPPINPASCWVDGGSTDGVIQQDQVRGCRLSWPPCEEEYAWEALQGLAVAAELLARQGFGAWDWGDRAVLRSVRWLHSAASYPASGDDSWIPWLINARYGTDFPARTPSEPGKNFGFADWLYAGALG